jgi:hypothetical protein
MQPVPPAQAAPAPHASRRVYPWAAAAVALASVLEPLSRNLHQAAWSDAVPPTLGAMAVALAAWALAVAVRRRADAGAALVASVWTAGTLLYLELFRHLNDALGGDYTQLRALPFALALMVGLTLALRGTRSWHGAAHTVVACIAVALLASPAWRAASFEWRHGAGRWAYDGARAFAELPALAPPGGVAVADAPDIYHFVFDRYGSEETLRDDFGVTTPIGDFLEAEGFYVARDSFSNYVSTAHALAAMFHMDYIDALAADPRVSGPDWRPLFAVLDDHRVGRFLREAGYERHQFGSWWGGTFNDPTADANRPLGFNEFTMTYLRRSIALPLLHVIPVPPFARKLAWDNGQCQRVARQVAEITALRRGERPLHVFAHFLLPHGPYAFGRDGTCLTNAASVARGERQGYVEQVAYADAIIRELVTALSAEGRPPAAILIHADEGPIPERDMTVPWQEASDAELRIKFGILAAFRLPGGAHGRLRQDISPVNVYRATLATVFGLDLPDLPDRMYVFPDHADLYDLRDMTARVLCASADAGATTPPDC